MEGIKEMTSSVYSTVKIVLERCPKTEKALQELQNYHHHHLEHCTVCGSYEELIDLQKYGWTPLQSQLFKKRVLEWTLEVSVSGGGRGGDSLTTHDDDDEFGWSCEGCMAQFEMLALVQRQIADLEKKEKEIVSQLKETIGNRIGVVSQPNLAGTEPEVTTSFIFDVEDNPLKSTPMMTDAASDEGDVDLKPVILEEGFQIEDVLHELPDDDDGVDDGPGDDIVGGADLISEEPMNHSDEGSITDEDQPSPKKSRRCKTRATQAIISPILRNDDIEVDGENEEYSPTIESDTDSDNMNESELDRHIGKGSYNRKRGGMSSHPSTLVQIDDGKHIGAVYRKQVGSDRRTFSCETCHKTFSTKGNLSKHRQRIHLKELPHKCQNCGKGFYEQRDLRVHLKMRNQCTELLKNKKFICPICKDGFTNKPTLQRHTRQVHNGEKRTKCPHPKCNYYYVDKTKLELHSELRHPQDEKEISCTICNQKFSSVKEKLAHVKSNHTCKFCNKSIPNKAELDEHQTTHHDRDRPYFSSKCGNRFPTQKCPGTPPSNYTLQSEQGRDGEG